MIPIQIQIVSRDEHIIVLSQAINLVYTPAEYFYKKTDETLAYNNTNKYIFSVDMFWVCI